MLRHCRRAAGALVVIAAVSLAGASAAAARTIVDYDMAAATPTHPNCGPQIGSAPLKATSAPGVTGEFTHIGSGCDGGGQGGYFTTNQLAPGTAFPFAKFTLPERVSLSALLLDGWSNATVAGGYQLELSSAGETSPTATSGWTTLGNVGPGAATVPLSRVLEAGSYILRVNPVSVGEPSTGQLAFTRFELDGDVLSDTHNGGVAGNVPATLSLTLTGATPSFGAFAPGADHTYDATQAATITSTAGDATLSVSDPASTNTGKLVNGTFTLAERLQAKANTGSFASLSATAGEPLNLLTYNRPVSSDPVTIGVRQHIGANEPLRTGAYTKTLTFTLSTTTP